jgi:hypothetical protein
MMVLNGSAIQRYGRPATPTNDGARLAGRSATEYRIAC